MLHLLIAAFLAAHGLIYAAIWLPTAFATRSAANSTALFDPGQSWLLNPFLGDGARWPSVLLAVAAAGLFLVAGAGLFAHHEWWGQAAVGASIISLTLVALYFTPWLSLAVAIDVVLIYAIAWTNWLPTSNTAA